MTVPCTLEENWAKACVPKSAMQHANRYRNFVLCIAVYLPKIQQRIGRRSLMVSHSLQSHMPKRQWPLYSLFANNPCRSGSHPLVSSVNLARVITPYRYTHDSIRPPPDSTNELPARSLLGEAGDLYKIGFVVSPFELPACTISFELNCLTSCVCYLQDANRFGQR